MLQGQTDGIQAVEQAVTAELVDLETEAELTGAHLIGFQIHFDLDARLSGDQLEQGVDLLFLQAHRHHAVVDGVAVEDIGKARGYDDLEAVVGQRPGGVLAARATAEVLAGQQDAGTGELRLVEHELGVGLLASIVEEAPVVEQVLAKTDAVDLLQKLLGNDGVGVDVGAVEGDDDPFMLFESCHLVLLVITVRECRRSGR